MIGILALCPGKSGGLYQYTQSLIESLIKFTKYKYLIIKSKDFVVSPLPEDRHQCLEVDTSPSKMLAKIKRLAYLTVPTLRSYLNASARYKVLDDYDIDLLINPSSSLLPIYARKPFITTIHDMQHKYYPQFFTFREKLARNLMFKFLAQESLLVVCESNQVSQDLTTFVKTSKQKIRIIPSPPPSHLVTNKIDSKKKGEVRSKYRLEDYFFFYPAQFWPHKNHTNLIRALRRIKTDFGKTANLVLAGYRNSNERNFANVMAEVKKLKLESCVKYLGYVCDDEMQYLYKLSTALVMPTLFESLSMPIWEAFLLGVPVVCSNTCALPEQIGNAGLLFDPNNVDDMAEKMYKVWTDQKLRRELVKKGFERAKSISLESCAALWEKVIDEALAKIAQ